MTRTPHFECTQTQRKADIVDASRHAQALDLQGRWRVWCNVGCVGLVVELEPGHGMGDCGFVEVAHSAFGDLLPVSEHGQAFGNFQHLAHLVADEQNGDALRLQIANNLRKRPANWKNISAPSRVKATSESARPNPDFAGFLNKG